jgi:RNA polymerase sigma-70 factor (ECF subfamily)
MHPPENEDMGAAAQVATGPAQWDWTKSRAATLRRWGGDTLDADAILVERCLEGQETAWEDLVKSHTRRVYGICFRFTSRDSEAQDLTQEVFLRVFKNLCSFRAGEGSFVVC